MKPKQYISIRGARAYSPVSGKEMVRYTDVQALEHFSEIKF